jgi:hypothetical protein
MDGSTQYVSNSYRIGLKRWVGGEGAGIVLGPGFRARNVSIFQSTFRVARIRFFRAGRFGTSTTGVSTGGGRRGGNDTSRWIRRDGIGNRSGRRRSFAPGETGIDRRIRECPGRNRHKGIYKYGVSIQMVIDYINHVRESYSVSVYYIFISRVGRSRRQICSPQTNIKESTHSVYLSDHSVWRFVCL